MGTQTWDLFREQKVEWGTGEQKQEIKLESNYTRPWEGQAKEGGLKI